MKLASAPTRWGLALTVVSLLISPAWVFGGEAPSPSKRAVLLDGGRYHLGDGKFNRYAADEGLMAQETVGPKYSFPFRVGHDGTVSVRIGKVLGVDSGSTLELYAGIKAGGTVYLERVDGGRMAERVMVGLLEPSHNHASFQSKPLEVKTGTYLLTVESNPYTLFDRDDIQIEGLSVATDALDLTIEPLWIKGKVYSGSLDLSLVPAAAKKQERLEVEVAAPPPHLEEPPTPEPSGRGRASEGLELDLEVKGREEAR